MVWGGNKPYDAVPVISSVSVLSLMDQYFG
jgi:hypothetical protein